MTSGSNLYPTPDRVAFRLGEWLVEPEHNRLTGPDGTRRIEPKAMEVLVLLAGRPRKIFAREEILNAVWGDATVLDEDLEGVISELRRLLDDDRRDPRFLETTGKGSCRLLVAPWPVDDPTTPAVSGEENSKSRLQPLWIAAPALAILLVVVAMVISRQARGPGDTADLLPTLRAVPLTSYPGEEAFPALSPDGLRVAFGWGGPEDANLDVYVKQLGAEPPLRLTDDPGADTYPRWSADGGELAYLHADQDGQSIYSVPVTGAEPRLLVRSGGWLAGHSWSPDGRHLVYAEGVRPSAPARLFLLDLETGVGHPLLPAPTEGQGDVGPVYSPDGASIAFSRVYAAGLEEIHVVSVAGGEVRQVTHGALHTRGLDWSRDGRFLVYSAASGFNYSLWRVDVVDGTVTGLPARGEWIRFPTIARRADQLVYQETRLEKKIWQIRRSADPDAGLTTGPLFTSNGGQSQGAYSSDGSRVAFVSTRTGNPEIWTAASDGSRPLQLTRFEGLNVGNPTWSPDGKRIAFHANPDGFTDLYTVGSDGTQPVLLSCGRHNHLMSSWSRDGQWIYYGCDRTGQWEIWRMRPGETEENAEQVTPAGGIAGYESVNGETLLFTKPDAAGLWSLSLVESGAEPGILFGSLPALGDWENWGCYDGGAVFVFHDPDGPVICVLDFDSGGIQSITRIPNIASPGLSVSRDGLSILYAQEEGRTSDLMMVEEFR